MLVTGSRLPLARYSLLVAGHFGRSSFEFPASSFEYHVSEAIIMRLEKFTQRGQEAILASQALAESYSKSEKDL